MIAVQEILSQNWAAIAGCAGLLVAFVAASLFLAVRAFRTYQRSV
jgi:hypothetical protein